MWFQCQPLQLPLVDFHAFFVSQDPIEFNSYSIIFVGPHNTSPLLKSSIRL
jgi:hypothetical protein